MNSRASFVIIERMQFFFLIFLFLSASAASVNRDILALWDPKDSGSSDDPSVTRIHQRLEFVFNHLGFKLTYHDLNKGLPDARPYAGIVTWFNEGKFEPSAYTRWLKGLQKERKKILIIGEPGHKIPNSREGEDLRLVNESFRELGWEFTGVFQDNPALLAVKASKGEEFTEFERKFTGEVPSYRVVRNKNPKNHVWLSLTTGAPSSESHVVIVGPGGAHVQNGAAIFRNPVDGTHAWRVNPFHLVASVFGNDFPVPDTTTETGRRIFFSHIDGDGFRSQSFVDRKKNSAEIIRDEILKKYDLPVTVSVIAAEMDPAFGIVDTKNHAEVARSIFALPNVTPASHTTYHPLSWARDPSPRERQAYGRTTDKGPILAWNLPNMVLDYQKETSGSLEWINRNLLREKSADLLLWSGSCKPPAEALRELSKKNFLNMNGGDSRFDREFPSIAHLSSLVRVLGGETQVYAAGSNENTYTDLWSPPFSGFQDVVETFERTENPRLKPVNVYYHFYSGEYLASLNALRKALDWVKAKELHPLEARDYVLRVHGFLSTKIERTDKGFRLQDYGPLRTFRLKSKGLVPDYEKSSNVLGHTILGSELYVTLGDAPESYLQLAPPQSDSVFLESSNARASRNTDGSWTLRGLVPVKARFSVRGQMKSFSSPGRELRVKKEDL